MCSGGEQGYQLGKEVKACTRQEREEILQEVQDGFVVKIPMESAVGDLGIPYHKHRAIRRLEDGGHNSLHNYLHSLTCRWFKECNVHLPSEKVMRKRAADLIGDNLEVEKVALTFASKSGGGEEVRMKPYGYLVDLWSQISHLLEDNERCSYKTSVYTSFSKITSQKWSAVLA